MGNPGYTVFCRERVYCFAQEIPGYPARGNLSGSKPQTRAAICGAGLIFVFVHLPKLLRRAIKAEAGTVIDTFGKDEPVKRVFWTLLAALAGIVPGEVMDPVPAKQIIGINTGREV